ncbi:SRPBCC family protein [Afipia sp. TerB]
MTAYKPDPRLDLVLERIVDVPPELVWRAWTEPKHLLQWFTPAPWKTVDCEIDLRPGGIFRTVMRSPEGEDMDNAGCYLEIVENRRLVFTDALGPGFRPRDGGFFTAIVSFEPAGGGTKYTAIAIHKDEAGKKTHEDMGFHSGWGAALDQLVAYAKTM